MEPKMGKRIVSKGEYVALLGQKATLYAAGYLLRATVWFVGIIDFLIILFILVMWPTQWTEDPGTDTRLILAGLCGCVFLVVPLRLLLRLGYCMMHKADVLAQVHLLTRFNTADLPAPETLVRASSEPMQEGMLLRAAAEGQETPPTELMRPVEEQE